jgi:hypothetical protein
MHVSSTDGHEAGQTDDALWQARDVTCSVPRLATEVMQWLVRRGARNELLQDLVHVQLQYPKNVCLLGSSESVGGLSKCCKACIYVGLFAVARTVCVCGWIGEPIHHG